MIPAFFYLFRYYDPHQELGSLREHGQRTQEPGGELQLTLSLPRVINIKLPLQPHQKYYITQYRELGFS